MATEEALDDIMRAWERAAQNSWSANAGCRAVALSVCYVALYLTLDRISAASTSLVTSATLGRVLINGRSRAPPGACGIGRS